MKALIVIFVLSFLNLQESPVGVWLYIQDTSKIEIHNSNGTLTGLLISSKNLEKKPGMQIFKNFRFKDGKWWGELYLSEKQHWVDASFEPKGDLLLVEYNYGFIAKRFHLFKESPYR